MKYAVAEASRRGAQLRVVSTYFPEYSVHGRTQPLSASEPAIEVDVETQTRRMVEEALADDAVAPPVDIVVAAGPPAGVLIDMSGEVDVLVVGHRGHAARVGQYAVRVACPLPRDRGAPDRGRGVEPQPLSDRQLRPRSVCAVAHPG